MIHEVLEGLRYALKQLEPFDGSLKSNLSTDDLKLIKQIADKNQFYVDLIESYSKNRELYIDLDGLRRSIKHAEANCAKAVELSKLPELAAYREALEAAEKALQELKEASGSKTVDADAKRLGLVKCYLSY